MKRWVEDEEKGVYDEAFGWPVEKRRRTFKMPGGGTKVADEELENHMVEVLSQCDRANMQVVYELLILEAVTFRPNWCGGVLTLYLQSEQPISSTDFDNTMESSGNLCIQQSQDVLH